jgi:hypothetical protein
MPWQDRATARQPTLTAGTLGYRGNFFMSGAGKSANETLAEASV